MLTPVDITNKVFKGGIGYDKKDVEAFMLELSTDYKELYSLNVELKDKITTLNESLQHYRSIEDSMQKALTLSEKTAEETVNAANDKARQLNIEAEMKAESMLADAKAELQSTKDEIYRLQQQYDLFKNQFTKILDAQKKIMEGEMVAIDLGANFEPTQSALGNFSGGGLGSEGGLGAGTYVGDSGRERTNQEPAFERGALNMDPFADAANGGGRFSKQTGGAYTGAKKKVARQSNMNVASSGINMKDARVTVSADMKHMSKESGISSPVGNANEQTQSTHVSQTVSREEVLEALQTEQAIQAIKAVQDAQANKNKQAVKATTDPIIESDTPVMNGEVENNINESHMLDSEDNYNEGFDFVSEETTTQFSSKTEAVVEDTYSGEVESRINESNMLDSEDNYKEGFDFVVEENLEEEIPTIIPSLHTETFNHNDDVLVGDVEDNVKQSNLIGNDDDSNEGFNFI